MQSKRAFLDAMFTWFLATVVIFLMTFNFYVNVWVYDADTADSPAFDVNPDHISHVHSPYAWHQSHRRNKRARSGKHAVVSNNVTMKNSIDRPPLGQKHVSTTKATKFGVSPVWPNLDNFADDRILAQMKHIPSTLKENKGTVRKKTILLYDGFKGWEVKPGQQTFLDQNCPVNACELTDKRAHGKTADAVLFNQKAKFPWFKRPPYQIWILYLLEAPYFTQNLRRFNDHFNWTASYRRDSDIVAPYEKFVKHSDLDVNYKFNTTRQMRNYASGKTKKVAWFASNCRATNQRLEYVRELSKHIQVDVFGKCGPNKCPRGKDACFKMLNKDYKFYLSFENSNCRDYITEKFFKNGLQNDVVPIVLGAAPEDYKRAAPHYSYIPVDEYTSPKDLADYLNELDKDDVAYNEYFKWKGTGKFINTYFWCRVCAMLHDTSRASKSYRDIQEWWAGKDVCIMKDRWGQHPRKHSLISHYNQKHLRE